MIRQTIGDVFTAPLGTARLLEGSSTLRRAKEAGLTYAQTCRVFPDAQRYTAEELDAFVLIAGDLVSGEVRFTGDIFEARARSAATVNFAD